MPFSLTNDPSPSELSEAVNYLLANFSPNLSADNGTGQITGPVGEIAGYLYKYMAVKYADSFDGSLNFSNSPINRSFYGLRNSNDPTESSNYADYVWYRATGGFGTTKSLWYISTGGRQIQFAVSTTAPDVNWLQDTGASIDLDVITSSSTPVIAQQFVPYFTPAVLQVPRTGGPLAPVFTGITPAMYASNGIAIVPFTDAQTDASGSFVNNTWRIGNSSTTGYGDISLTNITIGNPTDAGDYALWPAPTAMSSSPAFITVPVRYKNSTGTVSQAGVATVQLIFTDPGAAGSNGPSVDISGYTAFAESAGGAYNPATATLSAVYANVSSPTFSWSITGATPASSTAASVVITPSSAVTNVVVTLTVNGTNLISPISRTINMPVVYDGAAGAAGANGVMSAFPTIYQWTSSSTPPARPITTSTYTWSTGAFTAPSGWYTSAPSNTTAGNYLWSLTVPLNEPATAVTTSIDWTNIAYAIRAIAYNGANGANGDAGSPGNPGAATFVVTRSANDSSAPTNAEVNAVIGRNPVSGDIVTVSYNNYNNAVVYRYITSWVLFNTYITGSLIVQETITSDKMVTNLMKADNVLTRGLTVRDDSGNVLLSSGTPLNYTNITPSSGWLNSNVTLGTLGAGSFATLSQITAANASTYIAGASIGTAQVGLLTAANIAAGTIWTNNLQVGSTPALSGTTMTGAGAVINSTGTFALGNSSTNIAYDGSTMYLNGNVVATGNINPNAVTNIAYASSSSNVYFPTATTWVTILNVTITSVGGPLLITANGNQIVGYEFTTPGPVAPFFRLVRDTTVLVVKQIPSGTGIYGSCDASISYAETLSAGTYTYYLQGIAYVGPDVAPGVQIPFLSVTELKR